jgi:hypothetical protein
LPTTQILRTAIAILLNEAKIKQVRADSRKPLKIIGIAKSIVLLPLERLAGVSEIEIKARKDNKKALRAALSVKRFLITRVNPMEIRTNKIA